MNKKLFEKYGSAESFNCCSRLENASILSSSTSTFCESPTYPKSQNVNQSFKLSEEIVNYAWAYNVPKQMIRPSSDVFPATLGCAEKNLNFPLSIYVQPNPNDFWFPTINFGHNPIIRCEVCRAYINPFVKFLKGGHKWRCNICKYVGSVPEYYFSALNSDGIREDIQNRDELLYGSYELSAGSDFVKKNIPEPAYIFVFDTTQIMITSGILDMALAIINELIEKDQIAGGQGKEKLQIGIITVDKTINIVCFQNNGTVIEVHDFDELPMPKNYLLSCAKNNKTTIQRMLLSLPQIFEKKNKIQEKTAYLGSALKMATCILDGIGGKIIIVSSYGGCLEEIKSNQKGKTNSKTEDTMLSDLISTMQNNSISVDLFLFSSQKEKFKNVAFLGEFVRLLAGDIHYYLVDNKNEEVIKNFFYEFRNCLTKIIPLEGVFRLRHSYGWEVTKVYGHYLIKSNNDLLSLANIDENKALIYEFSPLDSFNPEDQIFYVQSAFLYTSLDGEKKIRIGNFGIPLSSCWEEIIENADATGIFYHTIRKALLKFCVNSCNIVNFRKYIFEEIKNLLQSSKYLVKEDRKEKIPDNLIVLIYYLLAFLKHSSFLVPANKEENEETSIARIKFNSITIDQFQQEIIPSLFFVNDLNENSCYLDENEQFVYPEGLPLKFESIKLDGIYLMDTGSSLILFIGKYVDSKKLKDLFGYEVLPATISTDMLFFNRKNVFVEKLSSLVSYIKNRKPSKYAPLFIVMQGDGSRMEAQFYYNMIEDKYEAYGGFSMAYADFYLSIMKTIQKKNNF